MKPLNGEKTHPLSDHARQVLLDLTNGPKPEQEINPGVVNRLQRGGLIESCFLASPYASHKGKPIAFARITKTGFDEAMKGRKQ